MGYLSCNAESAILTSNSHTPTTITKPKKKKNKYKQQDPEPEKPIKFEEFHYRDLEVATNNFSDQKLLGKGSHGCVYKAVLGNGRLVAVKKPSRPSSSFRLTTTTTTGTTTNSSFSSDYPLPTNEVDNEIDILSKIQNPNLVNLVGFTTDSTLDRLLVVEFMSNGTLYQVLHSSTSPPSWGRRIKLALQTAKAIDTLHSSNPPVIHRDIKSANILIDRNFNARLGDFGLALRCHADDFRLRSTPPAGTIGYLDPGYVTPDNLSTKTDVFSFGILLLEIISGRKAIDIGYSPPSIVDWAIPLVKRGKSLNVYDPRILPPKDPFVRKQFVLIASKCVRSCKERRPSMKDVVEGLTALSKLVPVNGWKGFSVSNPCMMIDEAICLPVESRNSPSFLRSRRREGVGIGQDVGLDTNVAFGVKNSRRVYSDLGIGGKISRSNLMDLMAEKDDSESDCQGKAGEITKPGLSKNRASSLRVESDRTMARNRSSKSQNNDCDNGNVFQLRRNLSVGRTLSSRLMRSDMLGCSNKGEFQIQASNPV